jgi:hypothetical protein
MSSLDIKNKELIFHCLWRVPGDFGRKQAAVLKSIIVNHFEHLDNLKIYLWSNVDLSSNEVLIDFKTYITFKKWDYDTEKLGTPLENNKDLKNTDLYDSLCWIESDIFRILILYKYGGFYIDMDVLILRNMLPLNDYEFVYQWGSSGNGTESFTMNNAIMRLNKGSQLANEILELITKTVIRKNYNCFGRDLFLQIKNNKILVLPCIWFNSEWVCSKVPLNPFKNIGIIELFDGAYTWHWHNRWNHEIDSGSKFYFLESLHNLKLLNLIKGTELC